jgi:cytochrome c oxidase subunit IV
MGPRESSELQQPASVSVHSMCSVRPKNCRILWESATYSYLVDYLGLEGELSVPMVLVGDFNISEDDRAKIERIPA